MRIVSLLLILAAGLAVGVVTAVDPALDLRIAAHFHRPEVKAAVAALAPAFDVLRDYNTSLTLMFVLTSASALALKLIWPRGPMLVPARAAILIISVFALGPALLANGILKPQGNRPRPAAVAELGGNQAFVQWWDWRGECDGNCSFISGEASTAFALLAPAVAVPPPWRGFAIAGAVVFGAVIGFGRIAVGAHFLTDILFSGVFMALIVWLLYGWIFAWRRTAVTEHALQQILENHGMMVRAAVMRLWAGRRTQN